MNATKLKKREPLSRGSEWTFELLEKYDREISRIASDFKLDTYPNQIEVISSEQMLDAYASSGMPIGYHHWSFGKRFLNMEKQYKRGQMGLAYEIVINSNPTISYLLEENSITMQALVIAHACYGHNSFFKSNYLFSTWTIPESIIDYLVFARSYIAKCEEKYGLEAVEEILDACHALMNQGVDRYKHPAKLSLKEEKIRQKKRQEYIQSQVNELWRTIPLKKAIEKIKHRNFPEEPQENLLYFIEKHAPLLEPWQREIIRIVRKIAQYFYPQRLTKVMNEGWATFWHYQIIQALYDEGLVTDEFMLEFIQIHTNVLNQPEFDMPGYYGINPYVLGYHLFREIKRICESPTEEDQHWFPELAHTDWIKSIDFAMRNFKDDSFIAQYLTPNLIRKLKLFSILNNDAENDLIVSAIHDEAGYQHIRNVLSDQFNLGEVEPSIYVQHVDVRGDRSMLLRHMQIKRRLLHEATTQKILRYIHSLWGFPVKLESVDAAGNIIQIFEYPEEN